MSTSTSVLITGGSEGIGRGLAQRFAAAGAAVLVTGRSPEKLARVATELGVRTHVSDVSRPDDREALARHVRETMPSLDLVIHNAGMQRRVSLAADHAPWSERQLEIDTLFAGPLHLTYLLIPSMLAHGKPSTIVNVTSGGAYVPQVFAPVYSACKAALHNATMTLRDATQHTAIRVVELVPPAVQTSLAGGVAHGAALDEFCDAVFPALMDGSSRVIGFGPTANIARASQAELEAAFAASAARFSVERY